MVDKNLILRKISELEEYITQLEELKDVTVEEYSKDWKIQRAVERTLQIAIELCVDIANHIISDEGWRVPVSYSDTFKVLKENKVIDNELFSIMERMARFRNIIVHNYDKLDQTIILDILKKNLEDFMRYRDSILKWLAINLY
ncbi:TPA: DUF86 domain-containing protein [bacterium]|nr:DUF86 domain-containing protein [bacterium]